MKNIVLALPNFRWREARENIMWHYIPYGLCMLAAVLEKTGKYNISIVDAYKENLSRLEFAERIKNLSPNVVGLTILMDYFGVTLHMAAEIIKMSNDNIQVVAGGYMQQQT